MVQTRKEISSNVELSNIILTGVYALSVFDGQGGSELVKSMIKSLHTVVKQDCY